MNFDSDQEAALAFLSFEPEEVSALPRPGTDLGEYHLLREIGRGGGGVVFAARQKSLDRTVALKLIPLTAADLSPAHQVRIEREARLLASLRHPNVVEVYDSGILPGFRWLAMELVEGWSLAELLAGEVEDHPRPGSEGWLRFAVPVLHQVASALAAAHQRGIIHRDVKPANILIDRSGKPFLVDFGLARQDTETGQTLTVGFVGTPRYASPEQARGEALTTASDVFSFGAVAFEVLGGRPAFDADTATAVFHQVQFSDPCWPADARVPRDLRAVVEKCLEKTLVDGYTNSGQVELEIGRFLRFEPVLAVTRGRFSRALRRLRRRPLLPAAAAVFLLLIALVGLSLSSALRQGESVQRLQAVALLEEAEELFHRASAAAFEKRATELLAGEPVPGLAGLVADRRLDDGNPADALALYQRELDTGGAYADRLGAAIAAGMIDPAALPALPPAGEPVTARGFAQLALAWMQQGVFASALDAIEEALDLEPMSFPYRHWRGICLEKLCRKSEAVKDLRIALSIRPASIPCLNRLHTLLGSLGRAAEAEIVIQQARALAPDDPFVIANAALSRLWLDDLPGGLVLARQAQALDPEIETPWAWSVLGLALLRNREIEEARTVVARALQRHPESPSLWMRMGWVEFDSGELELARGYADRLTQVQPLPWSYFGLELLGAVLTEEERDQEAFEVFRDLSTWDPEAVRWPWSAGRALVRLERFGEAAEWVERALDIDPQRSDILLLHTWIQRERGLYWEAQLDAVRAFGVDPENGQAAYWIARTWLEMENAAAGIPYARVAVQTHPDWVHAWTLLAQCQRTAGAFSEAEENYRRALALEGIPAVRADYAEVLDLLDRDQDSLAQYQQARSEDPKLPTAWCGEGCLRLRSGDPAVRDPVEALRLLRRALELQPGVAEYAAFVAEAEKAVQELAAERAD